MFFLNIYIYISIYISFFKIRFFTCSSPCCQDQSAVLYFINKLLFTDPGLRTTVRSGTSQRFVPVDLLLFNTKYMAFSSRQKHEIEARSCSQLAYQSNGAQMVNSYGI